MLKTAAIVTLALATMVVTAGDNVFLELDPAGLSNLLREGKFSFVIFHGHDCPYCDYLKTMLKELGEEFKEEHPNLSLGLVNAEVHHDVRKSHEINSYPVAKLFSGEKYFNFFVQRLSKDQVKIFVQETLSKKAKPTLVDSDKGYVKYNNHDYSALFVFPEIGEAEKKFADNVQNLFPTVPVFYTKTGSKWDQLVFSEKTGDKKYKLFFKRDFDEGDKKFTKRDGFDPEDLAATIRRIMNPRVQLINQHLSDEVFSGLYPGLVLFDKDLNSIRVTLLTKILLEHSFHGVALKTNGIDHLSEAFFNNLGVQEEDMPCLRILGVGGGKINKFKFEGNWNEKDLKEFLNNWKDSKLKPYLKNARPIPHGPSKVRAWNREEYYKNLEDDENVLVVGMTGKWCAKCREIRQLFEETRGHLKDKKSFLFATVDLDMNDIDSVDITRTPIIQIVQNKKAVEYIGEYKAEKLAAELNGMQTEDL